VSEPQPDAPEVETTAPEVSWRAFWVCLAVFAACTFSTCYPLALVVQEIMK